MSHQPALPIDLPPSTEKPDCLIAYEGSIILVTSASFECDEWLEEHCEIEDWQRIMDSFAVETRYAVDLIAVMLDDGLVVKSW